MLRPLPAISPCPTPPAGHKVSPRRLMTSTGPIYPKSCPDHRLPLHLIAHSAALTPYLRWIRANAVDYTVLERLGEGATKEVFLARDETLQRDVALCIFKKHMADGYLERVKREARVLAGLNHPHIVDVYDFQEDSDGCYMITERVAGGNLKARFAPHHREGLELDDGLRIGAEVAQALDYTHGKGVFHRDVKPSNVLLTPEGLAKLSDFGMAKPLGEESITETGAIMGTVQYMSPEQANGLPATGPSDMYSFGVLLYEMVTGRRPFHGEDVSVLVHHLESTPPPPSDFYPACPDELERLILRLLAKESSDRPTAGEAADTLNSLRADLDGTSAGLGRRLIEPTWVKDEDEPAPEPAPTTNGDQSSVESLSMAAVNRQLASDALQYPTTIVPAFFAALALIAALALPGSGFAIGVFVASSATAAASFLWRYLSRRNEEYSRWRRQVIELQDRQRRERERRELDQLRETLRRGFSSIRSTAGQVALRHLVAEHELLKALISRRGGADHVFGAQIPALAEETYRQGLYVLESVLELLLAIDSSNKRALEAEVAKLEKEITSLRAEGSQSERIRRETSLSSCNDRLELMARQELKVEDFLLRADLSHAALQKTRIELAALKADGSNVGVIAVSETLQRTIDQAKEVQEELRRLGY